MSRRTFGLKMMIVVVALCAAGLGAWDHYVRRPREKSRAWLFNYYGKMATHLQKRAESPLFKEDTSSHRAIRRGFRAHAAWYEGRARVIGEPAGFDHDREKRLHRAYLSKNQDLLPEFEFMDQAY